MSDDLQQDTFLGLLHLLADGAYHSGEELGQWLGVSRAAVWKQVQKLEQLGVELSSQRGKGYCIKGGLELLQERAILAAMSAVAAPPRLIILPETDSTNSYLINARGLPNGSVCLAERQLAGRGRRGRAWVSPFARNIYLSMVWRFEGGASVLEGLSLAVGVAIARALASLGITGIALKWPNDILYRGKKLAGILLEMSGDPAGECQVVIGVGVNVHMGKDAVIDQPWTDLASIAADQQLTAPDRNALAAALISELHSLLQTFAARGFAHWRPLWMSAAAYIGDHVCVLTANNEVCGTLVGVDDSGALVLSVEGHNRVFHGGEVSLRRRE
ncbi:MAG TPA: bifunctional biotin--[acetyl-CoA-carboxylase] ligase/biotin operon repressor BirA [Cellvibrionaceae bacterium]